MYRHSIRGVFHMLFSSVNAPFLSGGMDGAEGHLISPTYFDGSLFLRISQSRRHTEYAIWCY
jgi:hypothetical protein